MSLPDDTGGRPLYAQVRERLIDRIRSGEWKPGQLIANEFEIAAEFGVSQGTARKAIGDLASEGLVVRRQGRGTFVVEHTPAHVLFRFFNLFDAGGVAVVPDSRDVRSTLAQASSEERKALGLDPEAGVIRISRVRTRAGAPFITEKITLPDALFPGLAEQAQMPNTLYDLFQKAYGVLVTRTDDRLSAVAADAETAAALGVLPDTPLLRISRIAFGLDDKPVEWRVSLCHLADAHYLARSR
jgi:GntR family transcriptional regulator